MKIDSLDRARALVAVPAVAACGYGFDAPPPPAAPLPLQGTAAKGAAIAGPRSEPPSMRRAPMKLLSTWGLALVATVTLIACGGGGSTTPTQTASMVTLNTRPGVTQKFILIKPNQVVASVILFAGGGGVLSLSTDGAGNPVIGNLLGNFLVRTRQDYVDRGFMVALIDVSSDNPNGIGLARGSAEHAQDVAAVVAYMRQQVNMPVWLVGTSAGSQSAANAAVRLTQGIGGMVLTSSVTVPSSTAVGVLNMDLESIPVPAFVMSHAEDQCASSPPADAQRIADRLTGVPKKLLTLLTGGSVPTSGPCEALSQHGFFGIELQAVDAITNFIKSTTN